VPNCGTVRRGICVIGEAPALGVAVMGLLEGEGVPVQLVPRIEQAERLLARGPPGAPPLLLCASNRFECGCVARYRAGAFPATELILVGSRNPKLVSEGRLHVVALPLRPMELLRLVRRLLRAPTGPEAGREPAPPPELPSASDRCGPVRASCGDAPWGTIDPP
jgi:hypothetical protein